MALFTIVTFEDNASVRRWLRSIDRWNQAALTHNRSGDTDMGLKALNVADAIVEMGVMHAEHVLAKQK